MALTRASRCYSLIDNLVSKNHPYRKLYSIKSQAIPAQLVQNAQIYSRITPQTLTEYCHIIKTKYPI